MTTLMTPTEFRLRAVGVPWAKWRADWGGVDCFGLIVMWHRHVLGIELGEVPHTDIAAGFAAARGWPSCDPVPGATCWMAWRDGAPRHCGVLLTTTEVIHAEGNDHHPGNVRVSRLRAVRQLYGEIRFHRYEAPPC